MTTQLRADAPVVEVRSLLVRYGGNPSPTLEEISFSVPRGSVYALLGRNGAGKSSLVRCLLGQQKPTAGACSLFGEDVVEAPRLAHGEGRRRARGPRRAALHDGAAALGVLREALPHLGRAVRRGAPRAVRRPGRRRRTAASRRASGRSSRSRSPSRPPRAPRPRRPDARPRRGRAARVLRGARRRAGRPRDDRPPDVARPRGRREHGDARRVPEGRQARPRRGPRDAEGALPAPALRERGRRKSARSSARSSRRSTRSA